MPTQPLRFLPGTLIEIVRDVQRPHPPRIALFDFDGTLSLIREGWADVMIPMMVDHLMNAGAAESPDELHTLVGAFVMELTGKQTIYQMIRLAEEITKRGGTPKEPLAYKYEFHELLMNRIESRRARLRTDRSAVEEMLVPGAQAILQALDDRDVVLVLASGTDQNYVREEVELLGLSTFFQGQVYGAVDDYQSFSKAKVIQRIIAEHHATGNDLIGFGDGYVEIENVNAVGGTTVAVASDERNRSGLPDPWKRERLIGVGADVVVPDFREHVALIDYLWR